MTLRRLVFLISASFLFFGCSNPFGPNSYIDKIANGIDSIFGKTSSNLVAGGAKKFSTSGSYNGSVSVGNYINQSQTVTNGGYTIITSVKENN